MLPVWRERPDDLERLRPIRRVFHTLMGSGRLVGARALGEFSWKVENMLHRVLDGTREASPAVVAMVDQAFYTLPQLLAALRGTAAVDADLRSEEHTSELQSLMRISYAGFCLKKRTSARTKHTDVMHLPPSHTQ